MKTLFGLLSALAAGAAANFASHAELAAIIEYQAICLVAIQLVAFALLAFPLSTLIDSLRVTFTGEGKAADAPEMAVGVFSTLGRASTLAGINGAIFGVIYVLVFARSSLWLAHATSLAILAVGYGMLFKLVIAGPLEKLALGRANPVKNS